MNRIILSLIFLFSILTINGQEYFPNNESVQNKNNNFTAFTNAKIYVTPTQIIEKGTLIIQNGKVIGAGINVDLPKNCKVINLEGKSIYPSFIDIYTSFGIEKPKKSTTSDGDSYDTKRIGYYWNESIRTEINAFESFHYDQTKDLYFTFSTRLKILFTRVTTGEFCSSLV